MASKPVKMPIGLRKAYWAPVVSEPANAHPVYGSMLDMGTNLKAYLSVQTATLEIPGDDVTQLYDEKFVSGQLDSETNCSDLELNATVYGHSYDNGVESSGADDSAPNGAYGYIEPMIQKDKSIIYRATFLFMLSAIGSAEKQEADTKKSGSIDPKPNVVSYKILADATGKWRDRQEFATEAAADAWLRGMFGATSVWPVTVKHVGTGASTPAPGVTYFEAGQNAVIDFGTTDPTALYDNAQLKTSSIASHKYTVSAIAGPHEIVAIWAAT